MRERDYSHLVEIDEASRFLRVTRVFPDGSKCLFTEIPLPPATDPTGSQYAECARLIGESILMDSPAARRTLDA